MEDVKWLLKRCGFLILILLIVVIAGMICWGRLHTEEKKVAEEVWEPPVEIEDSETVTEEENDTETSIDSAYWFIPQSSDCLISEEEKKQLEAQLKELEGLVNEMGEISGNAVIDPTLFSSLDNALKPEMELESLEFLAEDGRIRIKILTDDTRDISGFIRIMEENGFIMDQSRWQKLETKVHGAILFKSGMETGHETQ